MTRSSARLLALAALALVLGVGLVIAILPERPASPLVSSEGWEVRGHAGRVPFPEFPVQFRQLRRSVVQSSGAVYRSWTPDAGIQEIEAVSPPFRAPRHLSIAITGSTRTPSGRNAVFLTCSTHAERLPVFTGSVNVNAAEALVDLPTDWCAGETRVELVAGDPAENVGVGTVFAVSALSAWKSSFVGLLPYFALALLVPAAIALAGAAASRRAFPGLPAPLTAASSLGIAALLAFFLTAILPRGGSAVVSLAALAAAALLSALAGRARSRAVARELAPYGKAWAVAAFGYFALLSVARNGLGHWEPNYRFWPASWSSDAELPWIFAEALRAKIYLGGLFGPWHPTDRPPLLTGGHLLLSGAFDLLQRGNDGDHLRGLAYNAAAVAFNALWVPALLFLLVAVLRMSHRRAFLVLAAVAVLPFAIFNTCYGWPKALGAAFGIGATAIAMLAVRPGDRAPLPACAALFGVLSAMSLLAHGSGAFFLLPVAAWFLLRALARRPLALLAGIAPGAILLASWAAYQRVVLPSRGPITKFALTGDFGFGTKKSLLTMIADRYSSLGLVEWLDVKARMLLQPLLPIDQRIFQIHLNADHGADFLGALRGWDFQLLSAGNVAVLVASLAVFLWRRPRETGTGEGVRGDGEVDGAAARLLVAFAGASWLLLAFLFLAPIILHHWPYAAVFVAAGVGFAWIAQAALPAFRILAGSTALYSGIVWFLGPLRTARDLDLVALVAFVALAGGLGSRLAGAHSRPA
jgi:hypothetical protein